MFGILQINQLTLTTLSQFEIVRGLSKVLASLGEPKFRRLAQRSSATHLLGFIINSRLFSSV